LVSIGQGGGHNGNGGRGTRNKALDIKSKLIRSSPGKSPLATLNKSLSPTPSTVINPDTTPDSGGSMFESETGEEEPKDKDKDKDKEKTTKKPMLNYAMEEDELNVHPEDEDYDYDSAPTLDIKNKSNKPILNKSLASSSSTVVKPASAPESGGSMFESETGEEEPKDKDKGKIAWNTI